MSIYFKLKKVTNSKCLSNCIAMASCHFFYKQLFTCDKLSVNIINLKMYACQQNSIFNRKKELHHN